MRRAIDVLFCFEGGSPALTPAEVAQRLAMNRTTAWRYLTTLASSGLVREVGDGRFGLGARTVGLAEAYTRQWGELEAAAAVALVRLRDAVGETAALHLRQGWSRVVVRQIESHHELHRTYKEIGQPISLLSGAPSLAILGSLPDHERIAFLDSNAQGRRDEAEAAIADAVRLGYATTRGSRVPGVASIAAAVRDPAGQVIAAINVTGPEERLPVARTPVVAGEVIAAVAWVEQQLAGASPRPLPVEQVHP